MEAVSGWSPGGWQWCPIPVNNCAEAGGDGAPPSPPDRVTLLRFLAATTSSLPECSTSLGRGAQLLAWQEPDWSGHRPAVYRLGVGLPDIGTDFEFSNACLAAQRHLLPPRWRDGHGGIHRVTASTCLDALSMVDPAWLATAETGRLRDNLLATEAASPTETGVGDAGG